MTPESSLFITHRSSFTLLWGTLRTGCIENARKSFLKADTAHASALPPRLVSSTWGGRGGVTAIMARVFSDTILSLEASERRQSEGDTRIVDNGYGTRFCSGVTGAVVLVLRLLGAHGTVCDSARLWFQKAWLTAARCLLDWIKRNNGILADR